MLAHACVAPVRDFSLLRAVHDQHLGDEELTKNVMDNYDNIVGRLRTAVGSLKHEEKEECFDELESFLGNSDLKLRWILEKVPHFAHSIGMSKVNCEVLSTDGFVSQIVRVKLCDINGDNTSVIVKMPETEAIRNALIATIGEEKAQYFWPEDQEKSRILGMMDQFNREIDFYAYNDIQGLKIPDVFFCQKWSDNSTGALIMEDLCHLKSVSFFDTLSLEQIEQVGGELKILHLYSENPSSYWTEKFPFPKGLLNLLKGLKPVVQGFVDAFPELNHLYKQIQHLYTNEKFIDYIMMQSHLDLGLPDVICHGDLWTYNFLWRSDVNDNASANLGAIIDWQGPHAGSIGEDFAHMLVFCCNADIRRKAERELLPKHYQSLSKLTRHYPKFTLENLLLDRIRAAWEDALEVLKTDLKEWAHEEY